MKIIFVLLFIAWVTAANAHDVPEPHDEPGDVPTVEALSNDTLNANVTGNGNENQNASPEQPAPSAAKFRSPATLLPLLLIPLAIVLYLIYEKISRRKE